MYYYRTLSVVTDVYLYYKDPVDYSNWRTGFSGDSSEETFIVLHSCLTCVQHHCTTVFGGGCDNPTKTCGTTVKTSSLIILKKIFQMGASNPVFKQAKHSSLSKKTLPTGT